MKPEKATLRSRLGLLLNYRGVAHLMDYEYYIRTGEMSFILTELTKPWNHEDVKFRVGSTNKDKTKGLPLAYVDARTVMERLDSAMGTLNWQDRYEFYDKKTMCYLSIRIDSEWITKADGAGDSDVEGEKGAISDAFKRASVKWGMGRELYDMKFKWMPINAYKQLEGDPWGYLIQPPENEKKLAARKFVESLVSHYRRCTTKEELNTLQMNYAEKIGKITSSYPDLSEILISEERRLVFR